MSAQARSLSWAQHLTNDLVSNLASLTLNPPTTQAINSSNQANKRAIDGNHETLSITAVPFRVPTTQAINSSNQANVSVNELGLILL